MPKRISPEEARALGLQPKQLTPDEAKAIGLSPPIEPAPAAPEIDVSDLNPKPEEPESLPQRAIREIADPTTPTGAGAQKFAQGASYKLSDELQGAMGAADEASAIARQAVGLEDAPEDLADPVTGESTRKGALKRLIAAYEKNRDAHRKELDAAAEAQPFISPVAELGGTVMAPGPMMKGLPAGATRLQRMGKYAVGALPVGAAFGFGGSTAEDLPGLVKDTAVGAGAAGLTAGVLGGVAHGPLSRLEGKEREAVAKAEELARETFDKPERLAKSSWGGVSQKSSRSLENAGRLSQDPVVDPLVARDLSDLLTGPEGVALKNRLAANTAKNLPGALSEDVAAEAAYNAAKAANTPQAVAADAARRLSPEQARAATLTRIKKYLGNTVPPLVGAAIGNEVGGPLGMATGGLIGGVVSSTMGTPSRALANWAKDPSIMMRLAQLGQSPATSQAAPAIAASLTTEEEKKRAMAERFRSLLGD